MATPSSEARALGRAFRLGLARAPRRGLAGAVLGRGPGASMEFHDRRAYAAGDDVRHLDWRAFARTDQLMVRLHREEVAPELDLILDASRSMAVEPEKAQRAVDLAAFLDSAARAGGYRARLLRLGRRPERLDDERFNVHGVEFDEVGSLGAALAALAPLLRPDSIRVLISDLLVPDDAVALTRELAARAGGLGVIQVLGAIDHRPAVGDALRLVDAETEAGIDLVLDRRTVDAYLSRLARLEAAWGEAVQRRGGLFARVHADEAFLAVARGPLLHSGLVEPG
ncbi:MAG: DUF58 domain-containing protein [Planctomycetota bacterium]